MRLVYLTVRFPDDYYPVRLSEYRRAHDHPGRPRRCVRLVPLQIPAHDPSTPSDTLANDARPQSDATLTIRVIKSFTFRTEKSLVLQHLDLTKLTVGELKALVSKGSSLNPPFAWILIFRIIAIATQPGWKPYRLTTYGESIAFIGSS